jgi:ATP-dependent DNA helicase RecQ
MTKSLHEILIRYWGYKQFRPMQEDIMNALLTKKDVLAIMPTGGGKSLCYQVPALAEKGICLVVSPLIALMRDQVDRLNSLGIPSLSIISGMRFSDVQKTLQNAAYGNFKFLYVSPERLETELFQEWLPVLPLNLVAIDEAHCISQWGYDFRPAYLTIAKIREIQPAVPMIALTASATPSVKDDICEKLNLNLPQRFQQSFERPNLSYSVFEVGHKLNKLTEIIRKVPGSAIVYCRSRKRTQEIAASLSAAGIQASYYHAGLSSEERTQRQEQWQKNEVPVMVCTNAFGMGIDKPDVRSVVHIDTPDCLESYYQEAGRAGRDGRKAYAVLLHTAADLKDLEKQAAIRFPEQATIKKVYQALVNYLQLPEGLGEDQFFEFDLKEFCQRFKLETQQTIYALKALEQEDLISYAEQIFLPPTVQFTLAGDGLLDWQKQYPKTEPLIKILLRSYGGIMDQPTAISEKQIGSGLKLNPEVLKKQLQFLNTAGVLNYLPQKEKPQIRFIHERPSTANLSINSANYRKRKRSYELRLQTMLSYAKEKRECRQSFIANYFTSAGLPDCNVCDNCINQRKSPVSRKEFDEIVNRILEMIDEKPKAIHEILPLLPNFDKEKTWAVIDALVGENRLKVDRAGKISRGK